MADGTRPPFIENLFPNVTSQGGLKKARLAGAISAAYLGATFILTAALTGHPVWGDYGLTAQSADDRLFQIVVVVISAIGWFFAAYRVAKRKGRIVIWIVLAYAIFSLITKLAYDPRNGLELSISLLVVGAAVNGVRATLEDRRVSLVSPSKAEPQFEALEETTRAPVSGKRRRVAMTILQSLRFLLVAASIGVGGFLTYIAVTEDVTERWIFAGFIGTCVLNAVYLLLARPSAEANKPHLLGLLSLWVDAKAAELRQRAKRADASDGRY